MHRSLDRSWKKRVETNELNPQKVETDLPRKITEKKRKCGSEQESERRSPAGDFGIFLNYNVHPIYSHLL